MKTQTLAAAAVIALVTAAAGTASAQSTLRAGQTQRGELSANDPTMADGSHYDCFRLQTQRGQNYSVALNSGDFDAYLALAPNAACDAYPTYSNDDASDGSTNSRVVIPGDGQVWTIRANSYGGGETGAYTLAVATTNEKPSGAAEPETTGALDPSLARPTDPEERYDWDSMCQAADTVALISASDGMTDDQLTAWLAESSRLQQAATASARAVGKTDDQLMDDVTTFGVAWLTDPQLMQDVPPAELRTICLNALR